MEKLRQSFHFASWCILLLCSSLATAADVTELRQLARDIAKASARPTTPAKLRMEADLIAKYAKWSERTLACASYSFSRCEDFDQPVVATTPPRFPDLTEGEVREAFDPDNIGTGVVTAELVAALNDAIEDLRVGMGNYIAFANAETRARCAFAAGDQTEFELRRSEAQLFAPIVMDRHLAAAGHLDTALSELAQSGLPDPPVAIPAQLTFLSGLDTQGQFPDPEPEILEQLGVTVSDQQEIIRLLLQGSPPVLPAASSDLEADPFSSTLENLRGICMEVPALVSDELDPLNALTDSPDNCVNAVEVLEGVTPVSTLGATTDGRDLIGFCDLFPDFLVHNDIWLKYKVPATCGALTVSTCDQVDFDTRIAIYDDHGNCPPLATDVIDCNDDDPLCGEPFHSTITVPVVPGNSYLIGLGGFAASEEGTGTITLLCERIVPPPASVTINEIRIDQGGNDDDEFFELTGDPNGSLDGLTYLVIGDRTADPSPNGIIDGLGAGDCGAVVDLTGRTMDANGFFVASEATFTLGAPDFLSTELPFENSDNVTHMLVRNFDASVLEPPPVGTCGDLDTDDDGVLDVTPWDEIVDVIAVIEEPNPPSNTEFHYGPPTVGPDGMFVPGHVFRCPDGTGDWNIGEFGSFDDDTPGEPNECLFCLEPGPILGVADCSSGALSVTWTNNDAYTQLNITIVQQSTLTEIVNMNLTATDESFTTGALAADDYEVTLNVTCANGLMTQNSRVLPVVFYNGETHLVWRADGEAFGDPGENSSSMAVQNSLLANGQTVLVIDNLAAFGCVTELTSDNVVWVNLGTFPTDHNLFADEGQLLAELVTEGVHIVIASADNWDFNPPTAFEEVDGVEDDTTAETDDCLSSIDGADFDTLSLSGFQNVTYNQDNQNVGNPNDFNDIFLPTGTTTGSRIDVFGTDAGIVWFNNPDAQPNPVPEASCDTNMDNVEDAFACGILYRSDSGAGDVICQTWELGGYGGDLDLLVCLYVDALLGLGLDCGGGTRSYIRGDCNGNATFDGLGDGLSALNFQFVPGTPSPPCLAACDANHNNTFDGLGDGLTILGAQFVPGSPPPDSPWPSCGTEGQDTIAALGCVTQACP